MSIGDGDLTLMGLAWFKSINILANSTRFNDISTPKVLIILTDGKYVNSRTVNINNF